jgi:hypothetical protein
MDVLIERCAGLDVHRDTVVAKVCRPGSKGDAAFADTDIGDDERALEELVDWLVSEKVTLAAMESTGVYWKPVIMFWKSGFRCG